MEMNPILQEHYCSSFSFIQNYETADRTFFQECISLSKQLTLPYCDVHYYRLKSVHIFDRFQLIYLHIVPLYYTAFTQRLQNMICS